MITQVKTIYDPVLNAHLATINPPLAAVKITVHVERYDPVKGFKELFLYNFDVDSNCIEFAFGEKAQVKEGKNFVEFETDPEVHVPPFRIQIMHQEQSADLSLYDFTISFSLLF